MIVQVQARFCRGSEEVLVLLSMGRGAIAELYVQGRCRVEEMPSICGVCAEVCCKADCAKAEVQQRLCRCRAGAAVLQLQR